MARVAVIEERLQQWAAWKGAAATSPDPVGDHAETDEVVSQLSAPLRATVERLYLQDGEMPDHVAALGCPTWTITRRIGRAHQVLLELLRSRKESAQRRHETADMLSRMLPGSGAGSAGISGGAGGHDDRATD